jgi:arylsulfatase A-like enzyme
VVTIAEVLRRSGYRTAALVSSTVLGPAVHLDQGFEEYHVSPGPWLGRSFGAGLLRRSVDRFRPDEAPPPDLGERVAAWLQAHQEEDFFLWLHVFDPHAPYGPPRRYLQGRQPPPGGQWRFEGWDEEAIRAGTWVPTLAERDWIRQLYLGEVRYVDDFAGRLVAELRRLGLYEDTLLVVLSDHGEEFWEHDSYGHGHTLYDELLHVPLVVKLPRSERTGPIDLPVSTASVMPTVLGLCGVPLPSGYPAEPSLLPHLRGMIPAVPALLSLGLNRFEDRQAVRFERFKYIRWEMTGREELYDLRSDPGERLDLARLAPRELEEGRRLLAGFAAESRRARRTLRLPDREEADLDAHTLDRLRALGYAR